jgi:O-antigen ligase
VQLLASLALGLFLACPEKRSWRGLLLLVAVAGLMVALVLTVTRASWLAFLVSAGLMLLLGTSRRTVLIAGACVIPLVLGGLLLLKQKRSIGFFDSTDQSTTWRETVWREGFHLLVSNPRHLLVGIGMDSLKAHWREWQLFDNGKIPPGHMHSNLLQIALERGIPALLVWLWLLGSYAWMLFSYLRRLKSGTAFQDANGMWMDRGIVLGALGGVVGFFVSGLVHYNWGDSEVVMILYFIMGLTLVIQRQNRNATHTEPNRGNVGSISQ